MVWFDNSRIFAIYTVVLLHVAAVVIRGYDLGSSFWWAGNIYDSAVRWCVPVFVMISGALLLDPKKEESLTVFYKKRVSRILIPVLFWSVIFLFWRVYQASLNSEEISLYELLSFFLDGKPYYHMWFMFMILSLYIFTPFFRKIVANSTKKEILFLVVISFIMASINFGFGERSAGGSEFFINWFLLYIPYFFLGYLIRHDKNEYSTFMLWVVFVVSFLLTLFGCYFVALNYNLDEGLYFYGYLSITVIPMSISVMYLFKKWNTPIVNTGITKKMAALTLGVYLIHPLFLETINNMNLGAMSFNPYASIFLVSTTVFLISLFSAWLILKIPFLRRVI